MSTNKKRYYGKKKKPFINKPETNFSKAKRLSEELFDILIDILEENSPEQKQPAIVTSIANNKFAQAIVNNWKDVDQVTGIEYCYFCGAYAAGNTGEIINHKIDCIYIEAQSVISNDKEKDMSTDN